MRRKRTEALALLRRRHATFSIRNQRTSSPTEPSAQEKLGQNFLTDGNIVEKSIAMADLPKGMATLEVGPGLGTLTQELLKYAQTVHAVEFDGTSVRT